MEHYVIFIVLCILFLVDIILKLRNNQSSKSEIFFKRDYFDKLLDEYILQSYELIYSKHILPFIANNVTIRLDEKDKFFVSISKIFLDVLYMKLGTMKESIYITIYGSEDNLRDYVLLRLSVILQEDVINNVIRRNTETEELQEQIETK